MIGKANKNEGIRIIADFEDRTIPLLNAPADQNRSSVSSRSTNEGIHLLADFENKVQPLNGLGEGTLTTLNVLLTKHNEKVHELVNELQAVIEDLRKENAELKANLVGNDRVIHRYFLDGPNEDEI